MSNIACVVPAYLKNEEAVVEETLAKTLKANKGNTVMLVWNGPAPSDSTLLKRVEAMGVVVLEVPTSTSKAENLNAALEALPSHIEFVAIFDADGHPTANAIDNMMAGFIHGDISWVQGRFSVSRGDDLMMTRADDLYQAFGFAIGMWERWMTLGQKYTFFHGHTAIWRRSVLRTLGGFRPLLTEDVDLHQRARKAGFYGNIVDVVCASISTAPTWYDFYKQRVRWTAGYYQIPAFGIVFSLASLFTTLSLFYAPFYTCLAAALFTLPAYRHPTVVFLPLVLFLHSLLYVPSLVALLSQQVKFVPTPRSTTAVSMPSRSILKSVAMRRASVSLDSLFKTKL